MRTTTTRLVAAAALVFVGMPTTLLQHALPEMATALVDYRHEALLAEIQAVNGPYADVASVDLPPEVERWRPLVAVHFPERWVDWGLRIIACESGGDPSAKNRRSSATGLFQFLRSTWNWVSQETGAPRFRDGGPLEPWWNVRNAAWLLKNGGTGHWQCRAPR